MSHPESIRALNHELAHVERLIRMLRGLPPAARERADALLDLALDLRADGARRLQRLRTPRSQ